MQGTAGPARLVARERRAADAQRAAVVVLDGTAIIGRAVAREGGVGDVRRRTVYVIDRAAAVELGVGDKVRPVIREGVAGQGQIGSLVVQNGTAAETGGVAGESAGAD